MTVIRFDASAPRTPPTGLPPLPRPDAPQGRSGGAASIVLTERQALSAGYGRAWPARWRAIGRASAWRDLLVDRLPNLSIGAWLHDGLLRWLTRRRPPIGLPVLVAVALAAVAWAAAQPSSAAAAAAAECYRYGQVVTLSGQYFARVAPVDDGVIRDPRTDLARHATLLSLASPLCVSPNSISRGVLAAATVQLKCPAIHPADGSELSIEGRLVGAHSGNGQTPVVLMCL